MTTRRRLLWATLGLGVLGLPRRGALADALPEDRLFDVHHRGRVIGRHRVAFSPLAQGFAVDTLMEIEIKLAFVTVFRYRQEGREQWRDGRLARSDIATDDDGTTSRVQVRETGSGLAVEGPQGRYEVAAGAMTDLGFWNRAILGESQLIDGQHGDLLGIRLEPPVEETIEVAGEAVPTVCHGIAATRARPGKPPRGGRIWYDARGRWVRSEIRTRGEVLTLELSASSAPA